MVETAEDVVDSVLDEAVIVEEEEDSREAVEEVSYTSCKAHDFAILNRKA